MRSPEDLEFQQLCQRVAKGYDQQKPIVIVEQGSKWFVADGHHRGEAARRAGMVTIPVLKLKSGTPQATISHYASLCNVNADANVSTSVEDIFMCMKEVYVIPSFSVYNVSDIVMAA
jgi:hypothetical protein